MTNPTHSPAQIAPFRPAAEGALLAMSVFAASAFCIASLYFEAEKAQVDAARAELGRLARHAAHLVDVDMHRNLREADATQSPLYDQAIGPLVEFHKAVPEIHYIYTVVFIDDRPRFVLDTATRQSWLGFDRPMEASAVMDAYESPDELLLQAHALQSIEISAKPYQDEFGTFLSGFAPIIGLQGEYAGIIGVDLNIRELHARLAPVRSAAALAAAMSLVIALASGALFCRFRRVAASRARVLLEAQSTLQLANSELTFATKRAEDATIAKSQFLANMSHEIRTPMNGLVGALHLIGDGIDPAKRKLLDTALASSDTLLSIIDEILDLSKIEANQLEMESRPFDAQDLMERACELQAIAAHRKGLEIVCVCAPATSYRIVGDEHRLRQVVVNLLNNAIKFTERGEIALSMRRLDREDGSKVLRIEISDTGIGIDDETMDRLFQPFSQANSSTTRKYGGTGLGLSICRRLTELMGGQIGVESYVGKGSTFWIELPATLERPGACISSPSPRLDRLRFLIIDGSGATRLHLASWLEFWGGEAICLPNLSAAAETVHALDHSARPQLDFVFADQRLIASHHDEWDAMRRDYTCLASAGIVALHRLVSPAPLDRRCDYLLHKPIRIAALCEILIHRRPTLDLAPKAALPAPSDESQLRILLVDDNITNRLITSQILKRRHGLVPETASNGHEAIQALLQQDFDLVLMDCMMPEMDGYDASRAIRQGLAGAANQNVPIIALTANAMAKDRDECLAAGMNDHLAKPIRPDELAEALKRWSIAQANVPTDVDSACDFDGARLSEISAGDPATVAKLLECFLVGMDETMAALREAALSTEDSSTLRFHAHRMKGSAADYGALRLFEAAARLEDAAVEGSTKETASIYESVADAAERARAAIAAFRCSSASTESA